MPKLGAIGLVVQFQPPLTTLAASATASIAPPSGSTSHIIFSPSAASRAVIASGSASVRASNCKPEASSCFSQPATAGAIAASNAPPAAIAAKCPRSRERATWPSSRAFLILRCEAGR